MKRTLLEVIVLFLIDVLVFGGLQMYALYVSYLILTSVHPGLLAILYVVVINVVLWAFFAKSIARRIKEEREM